MKQQLRALKSLAGPFPPFDPDAAPDEPEVLFAFWLQDAIKAGLMEPHAMTLSTVDEEGRPDARILILKNLDERGWHFATTTSGPKGRQIEANLSVALTFYWPELGRQVRIRGMPRTQDPPNGTPIFWHVRLDRARLHCLPARAMFCFTQTTS